MKMDKNRIRKRNINTVHGKGFHPPALPLSPGKPSKYCTWPSPALWGPGLAVSLVEAPGTEVLGSPCAPQPINAPLAPLDPVHSHWGKATHAGQSGQWWVQIQLRPTGCLDRAGLPSERGPRSSVLEISFSISLTVKSF